MSKPDLDERICAIELNKETHELGYLCDEDLAKIKEAFWDSEWRPVSKHKIHWLSKEDLVESEDMKTGQEFYDAFLKELGKDYLDEIAEHDVGLEREIMQAAKRAAGLNEVDG